MLKGREPIFLQTFHHAGIVVFMWALCVTEATAGGTTTTIFNSFIHTLMYTYYALAAFGVPCPFKQYLTMAQIVQFLIGVPIIVPTYLSSECTTLPQKLVTIGMQVYVSTLIVLFYRFYQSSYKSKGSDKNL